MPLAVMRDHPYLKGNRMNEAERAAVAAWLAIREPPRCPVRTATGGASRQRMVKL